MKNPFLRASILFILLIWAWFGRSFQPPPTAPAPVAEALRLLDSAEYYRANHHFDHSVAFYQQAQEAYLQAGMEEQAVRLFANIFLIYLENVPAQPSMPDLMATQMPRYQSFLAKNPRYGYVGYLVKMFSSSANLDTVRHYHDLLLREYPDDWESHAAAQYCLGWWYGYRNLNDSSAILCERSIQTLRPRYFGATATPNSHLPHFYPIIAAPVFQLISSEYRVMGYLDKQLEAIEEYERLLSKQKYTDRPHQGLAYNSYLLHYELRGDWEKALEYVNRWESVLDSGDWRERTTVQIYRGFYQHQRGDTTKAILAYKRGLELSNRLDMATPRGQRKRVDVVIPLVEIYAQRGQLDSAFFYFEKIRALAPNEDYRGALLYTAARLHHQAQRCDEAEAFTRQSEQVFTQLGYQKADRMVRLHTLRAAIAFDQGNAPEALRRVQTALAAGAQKLDSAGFYPNPTVREVLFGADMQAALYQKVKILKTLSRESDQYADLYYQTALLLVDLLERRLFEIERESSQKGLLVAMFSNYQLALDACFWKHRRDGDEAALQTAFQLSERSKSIFLQKSLQENSAKSAGGVPDSLLKLEKRLQERILHHETQRHQAALGESQLNTNELETQLAADRNALDSLKRLFEANYPAYYQLKHNRTFATISELQRQLPDSATLCAYAEGEQHFYLFLVQKDRFVVDSIAHDSALKSDLRRLQRALTDFSLLRESPEGSYREYSENAHRLYQKLGLAKLDPRRNQLFIIPEGRLNYIPFEVLLRDPAPATADYQACAFLLRDYSASYHYSATLYLAQSRIAAARASGSFLGFAAAYHPERHADKRDLWGLLKPLPFAQREVESLRSRYSGSFYLENTANETQFKQDAPHYRVIHLAMHGLADANAPQYSSLAFSDTTLAQDDGLLYVYEIQQLPLNADLVVLSACESGYGKYQRGEGVVSLGRSFMYAGVPSVLMTLWSVNDQSTAFLMERFYAELARSSRKDQALRAAKLAYLAEAPDVAKHPIFWAAFVQVGDARAIELEGSGYKTLAKIVLGILFGIAAAAYLVYDLSKKRRTEA